VPRRYADWRQWFKPTAAKLPELTPQEAKVISAWDLTLDAWNALSDVQRAKMRFNYMKAPRYVS
jgi:hypothetical protein